MGRDTSGHVGPGGNVRSQAKAAAPHRQVRPGPRQGLIAWRRGRAKKWRWFADVHGRGVGGAGSAAGLGPSGMAQVSDAYCRLRINSIIPVYKLVQKLPGSVKTPTCSQHSSMQRGPSSTTTRPNMYFLHIFKKNWGARDRAVGALLCRILIRPCPLPDQPRLPVSDRSPRRWRWRLARGFVGPEPLSVL